MRHFYGHARLGAELCGQILRRLRVENCLSRAVQELVLYHDVPLPPREKNLKRWLRRIGEEQLRRLLALRRADTLAHHPSCRRQRLEQLALTESLLDEIIASGACFSLRELAINGRDIMALGLVQGPRVGRILRLLLSAVMEGQVANERAALLEAARRLISRLAE